MTDSPTFTLVTPAPIALTTPARFVPKHDSVGIMDIHRIQIAVAKCPRRYADLRLAGPRLPDSQLIGQMQANAVPNNSRIGFPPFRRRCGSLLPKVQQ